MMEIKEYYDPNADTYRMIFNDFSDEEKEMTYKFCNNTLYNLECMSYKDKRRYRKLIDHMTIIKRDLLYYFVYICHRKEIDSL